jgi:uncharacterized protein YybS (DUF2232 family)
MAFDETRLFLWSGGAIAASGVLWFLPGLNVLSAVAAAAGLILIVARLGYVRAILASVFAAAIVLLIGSLTMGQLGASVNAAIYVVVVIIPGVAMGVAARGFASPARTIWYGFVPILFLLVFLVAYYPEFVDAIPTILRQVNARVVDTIERNPSLDRMLSDEYGPDIEAREQFLKEIDDLIVFFLRIMPGIIVVGFLSILVLGLTAAGYIAAKINLMIPRLRPFHLWRASDWWLIPTAVGLALAIISRDEFWKYAGGNMLVVTGLIYSTAGLAVVEAFLRRIRMPLVARLIVYIIPMIILPIGMILSLFMAVLGLMDSRFNLRREDNEKNDNFDEITDIKE